MENILSIICTLVSVQLVIWEVLSMKLLFTGLMLIQLPSFILKKGPIAAALSTNYKYIQFLH